MNRTFWYIKDNVPVFLAAVANDEDAQAVENAVKREVEDFGHGRAKPVVAVELTPEFYTLLGKGVVKPIGDGEDRIFKDAITASRQLGFKGNAVAQALAKAKNELKESSAMLRGVVWRYVEDEG